MSFTKITNAGFGLTTGTLVGVAASFSSTVSVGGTLTYEDVTNVDSVGLITARNGIEVTDKGVQVGTGATVDSAAANTLTFLTGGSEALRIDSSGKVGLGTDNPNKILKVEYPDPGSGSDGLTQKDTGNDTTTFFGTVGPSYNYIGHSGHAGMVYSSRDLAIGVDHNNSGVIKFYTGNAERLRITSDGKVVAGGNGTGYPSRLQSHGAGNLLDLNSTSGAAVIRFYESGTGRFDIRTNNGSSGLNFYDSLNGIERVRIDSSGNIGVGLANPAHQLELGNGDSTIRLNATAGGNAALKFLTNTGNVSDIVFGDTADDDVGSIKYVHSDDTLRFTVNGSERMRIQSNGYINGGINYSTPQHRFNGINATLGTHIFTVSGYQPTGGVSQDSVLVYSCDSGGSSNSTTGMRVQKASTTGRSINAAGTINASGADYAEYMTKAGDFTLDKGDICGINSEGKLTNMFDDAIGFVVKSTSPSYVGGDSWHEAIGEAPGGYGDDRTEEEIAAAKVVYQEALETARQSVDRIAFSGQVPVNVTGATAGQYIIPVKTTDGGITGEVKNEADLTLAQYMQAVGKVIGLENDGRAKIIVKVA